MTNRARLRIYIDIVSPWSFFAFKILERYCKPGIWDIEMDIVPFFLGGVMHLTGNKPPITVPAKGKYMLMDMKRTAQYYGLSYKYPSKFPLMTIKAMRLLCIIKQDHPSMLHHACDKLFSAYWQNDQDITNDSVLHNYLDPIFDFNTVSSFIQQTTSQQVKDLLISNTNEAIESGSFGAPWILVKKAGDSSPFTLSDAYFGTDRFPLLAQSIGKEWLGPFPERSFAKL